MQNRIIFDKLNAVPAASDIKPNTIYCVKNAVGFDLYISDKLGQALTPLDVKLSELTSLDSSITLTRTDNTIDLSVASGSSALSLITTVRNETGALLPKGTVVTLNGAGGNKPLIRPAKADTESASSRTFGVLRQDISHQQNGICVCSGELTGLNTFDYTEGAAIWLSPTVAGTFTTDKPSAPNHMALIGVVTRSHQTQGSIEIKVQNGFELEELHNVAISNPQPNDIIAYNSVTGLWTNTPAQTYWSQAQW